LSKPLTLLALGLALLANACAGNHVDEPDVPLPADVRADYAIFALRCSKCHSLSRPLNSGIDDDEYWKRYVERMRRQPGSGISVADTVPILRFLHLFSLAERKRKQAQLELPATDPGAPDASAPLPAGSR
jgi:hypothetical protein